jgi:hypothetical protein
MNELDINVSAERELTDAELAMIQGGNIFKKAWRWTKGAVKTVGQTFEVIGYVVTHPMTWVGA